MLEHSIRGLLRNIHDGVIVLPAMQRPFVWEADRIIKLVDSLLRDFPVGSVLIWRSSRFQRFRRFQPNVDSSVSQVFQFENDNSQDRYLVLDGQQRLMSLYIALYGSLDGKQLHIDALSGDPEDKDPGDTYYNCQFFTASQARHLNENAGARNPQEHWQCLARLCEATPLQASRRANEKCAELALGDKARDRLFDTYQRCAMLPTSEHQLQAILIDRSATVGEEKPLEEVLEIFVRVNSQGLKLQKSDLLMSLIDMHWNDVQPALQAATREINDMNGFGFDRDDVLRSMLLALNQESRFARLVENRDMIERLAPQLSAVVSQVTAAWRRTVVLLVDKARIHAPRLFRGGYKSILPIVLYYYHNPSPSNSEERRLVAAAYCSIASGVFAGAEARMGNFIRTMIRPDEQFPLERLAQLIRKHYGINSLDALLRRHLDLALNIAHGGITIDGNPDELQRDHIFPRSTLIDSGVAEEHVNHYGNFHFLRAADNLNKSNKPPHQWFKEPGKGRPSYSEQDLEERFLTWKLLEPKSFFDMVAYRRKNILNRASSWFGMTLEEVDALFSS